VDRGTCGRARGGVIMPVVIGQPLASSRSRVTEQKNPARYAERRF
jgi:hypothetical protein